MTEKSADQRHLTSLQCPRTLLRYALLHHGTAQSRHGLACLVQLSMRGLMQDWPLVVNSILDYAAKFHGEQEVITCTVEGPVHRYTYADMHRRSQLCALAMKKLGVG